MKIDLDWHWRAVQCGAALGLLGIAVQEMAEFSLQKPANALLFVILLAIAMYEPSRSHKQPSREGRTKIPPYAHGRTKVPPYA